MNRLIAVANTLLNYAEQVKDGACYVNAHILIGLATTIMDVAKKPEADPYSCPIHMKLLSGCIATQDDCCKCPLGREYVPSDKEPIMKACSTIP